MRYLVIAVLVVSAAAGLVATEIASAPPTRPAPPAPAAHPHVPVTRPGKHAPARPPQFVISSFDGAGGARLWQYWLGVAKRTHAHFTFFLSGVYLIDWDQHDRYAPPVGPRGSSAIGFAPTQAWADGTLNEVAAGYRDGMEIGTHYNGHFCGTGGVGTWTAKDWGDELDEFDRLVFTPKHHLPFGPGEIVGGRTPCLEGNLDTLYPVLVQHGFRYDASHTAPLGTWPTRRLGIWSFPLLELPFIGHTFRVVSMDYNFMANQMAESPAQIENETYRTLWNAFRASYLGNRAPLSLGNHFETWESWAYDHALTRFLVRACSLPEVRCASFSELADWLDSQTPNQRLRARAGRFPHARPALLNRS